MVENVGDSSISSQVEETSARKSRRRDFALEAGAGTRILYLLAGAAFIEIVFWKLQYATQSICCGDFDGYYHIRWSRLLWENMRQGHFPPTFEWLPLTTLNPKDYVDHHLLFHVFQIPLTWFGDLTTGAKVGAMLFASLALVACYWLILHYRIKYKMVWLVALMASSAPFLYRLSMAKAPPFSIIFWIIGIYLLFERKYWWLAPLSFLFAWTYDLFVIMVALSIIWAGIIFWSKRAFDTKSIRHTLLAPAATISGSLLGYIINPYFPKNFRLLYEHVLMKITAGDFTTSVGSEWYPYDSWYFLGSCAVAFIAMFVGFIAFDWTDRKRAERPLLFLIFSTLLLLAAARSKRFVEYWPPFAVLFAAFSLKSVFDGVRHALPRLPPAVMQEIEPYLDKHDAPEILEEQRQGRWASYVVDFVIYAFLLFLLLYNAPGTMHIRGHEISLDGPIKITVGLLIFSLSVVLIFMVRGLNSRARAINIAVAFVALALCLPLYLNVRETAKTIAGDAGPEHYSKGMDWIRANVPPGELIFNSDWDDFPKLFFYDTTHTYTSGLDPTYLLDQNQELGKLYEEITLGKNKDVAAALRDKFHARYIFTDNEEVHDALYDNARDSGWFDKVYSDDDCTILKLRDQKAEPFKDEADSANDEDTNTDEDEPDEESGNP